MTTKQYINYQDFGRICNTLVAKIKEDPRRIDFIYGPPRGGLPVAVHLSHYLNIPLITHLSWGLNNIKEYILVVDDICDTGKTLERLSSVLDKRLSLTATLFYKQNPIFTPDYYIEKTDKWIVFPWESGNEKPSEYHQEIYPDIEDKNDVLKKIGTWTCFEGGTVE